MKIDSPSRNYPLKAGNLIPVVRSIDRGTALSVSTVTVLRGV